MVGFTAGGEGKDLVAVLELCEGMQALGKPPSFDTVTRDVYPPGALPQLTPPQAAVLARAVASACAHLHAHGVAHGDVYAHNVMVDAAALGPGAARGSLRALREGRVKLGDLGAAYVYDPAAPHAALVQRTEVRAWACLCGELAALAGAGGAGDAGGEAVLAGLRALAAPCEPGAAGAAAVPLFTEAVARLDALLEPFADQ